MAAHGDRGPEASSRLAVERALASDPALGEELELITAHFDEEKRAVFWAAFAERCGGARPADAVLPALERAAAHRRGGRSRGSRA